MPDPIHLALIDDDEAVLDALRHYLARHNIYQAVMQILRERCGQAERYRKDGLVARFGADIALPDLLVDLVSCESPS